MTLEIITPRMRGFLATNAHPAGCRSNVETQIQIARTALSGAGGSHGGTALVLGASTGYGLASRIAAAFGCGMNTIGAFYERPPSEKKTASAGWYNTCAFHDAARAAGLRADSINGDAFSAEISNEVIAKLKDGYGPVQYVFYSLAAPTRTDPASGISYRSVLKPIGGTYVTKSIDLDKGEVVDVSFDPATDDEIAATTAVMGGDDLKRWVNALLDAGVLAPNARVIAYSYIGPEVTWPIYRSGTIGRAKEHLEKTAVALDKQLQASIGGNCWVSVNKAVVTQASAAIPAVPLYISLLYKSMKERGLHEEPIHQAVRMMRDHLRVGRTPTLDDGGRIRLDDWEMRDDVQAEVAQRWGQATTENLGELSDFAGYRTDFRRLFGFEVAGVDYDQPVETNELISIGA